MLANVRLMETARSVRNWWQPNCRMRASVGDDNLISVRVNHKVRIVGNHDDLAFPLGRLEQWDELVVNGFRIEILFRLVDDQWSVICVVERKVE